MTCYDVRFPEVARSLAVRGADVIIVSAAWVRGRLKERHWKLMTAARALENTCYVLACSEVSARNIGCSRVIDPLGEVIAQAGDGQGEAGGPTLRRPAIAGLTQISRMTRMRPGNRPHASHDTPGLRCTNVKVHRCTSVIP